MNSCQRKLVKRVTCPNCWARFQPEEVKFIAKHPNLIGDPVAGSNEYLRFTPMRFDVRGDALDDCEAATAALACPHCHLEIHEQLLEISPLFISLIGAPAAGKSYFLTSMIWSLRQLMSRFKVQFIDSDPYANSVIHDYENLLFMNTQPDRPTEIPKTQTDDPRLYRMVMQKDVAVRCPSPMQFTARLARNHPRYDLDERNGRVIVLYDNAGEDYLPHSEEFSSVATRHIAKSNIYFMLFDITQDIRFKSYCAGANLPMSRTPLRQEAILRNVGLQIRRYMGLPAHGRVKTPLVVIVPKYDVCRQLCHIDIDQEPYTADAQGGMSLNTRQVEKASASLGDLFRKICPEFLACAEDITSTVIFIPVSSLGRAPELVRDGKREFYGIRPRDIQPQWTTVPLLYSLCKWSSGIIPATAAPAKKDESR